MSFEITGKLIHKYETQQVNDRFRKREFVLELEDNVNGNIYTNYAKMQLVQQKCELLDRYNEGDLVKVNFNIKGNKWERDGETRYITSLDAWRLETGTLDAAGGGGGDQYNQGYNQSNNGGGNSGYNAGGGAGSGGYNQGGGGNAGAYNGGNRGGGYNQGPAQGGAANAGASSNVADSNADDLPF